MFTSRPGDIRKSVSSRILLESMDEPEHRRVLEVAPMFLPAAFRRSFHNSSNFIFCVAPLPNSSIISADDPPHHLYTYFEEQNLSDWEYPRLN